MLMFHKTSRRRKVKCDEGHPHCVRCLTAQVPCEGYAHLSKAKGSALTRPTRKAILLPKVDSVVKLSVLRPAGMLLGETELENRYLRHFEHQTTSGFESMWDWTIWNRLVLQGCHHEPFVRHAVIAIAALHKSLGTSWSSRDPDDTLEGKMAKKHREFAYLMYGKAVSKMQSAIAAHPGPRYALLACLLVVCFETIQENRYSAVTHALSGLKILEQSSTSNKSPDSPGSQSSLPDMVEDEIIQAFKNLDIQISAMTDHRPFETHQRLMNEDYDLVNTMPETFKNLHEARNIYSIIQRRCSHFLATTWDRTESGSFFKGYETQILKGVTVSTGNNIFATPWIVDETLHTDQKQFATEIDLWFKAFDPLFKSTRKLKNTNLKHHTVANMLRIQALTMKVMMAGVLITQEVLYDLYKPEFQEIVDLAGMIVEAREISQKSSFWGGGFLLDGAISIPLFLIMMRCRDPLLRRRAIKILRSWQIEGWWNPVMIAEIGEFLMEVEEKGMVDGFIPETSRAVITSKTQVGTSNVILVQLAQRTGRPDGGPMWTERFLTYNL